MKVCKQCGQELDDNDFKPYVSRSKGLRKSTVGRNTICRSCEYFNIKATALWNKKDKTLEEHTLLAQIAGIYIDLAKQGLDPIGAYARHVLSSPVVRLGDRQRKKSMSLTELVEEYTKRMKREEGAQ
jgi:hypothetical protein